MRQTARGVTHLAIRALFGLGTVGLVGCGSGATGPHSSGYQLYLTVFPGIVAQSGSVGFSINLPSGLLGGDLLIFTLSGDGGIAVDSLTIPQGVTAYTGQLHIPADYPDGTLYLKAAIPAIQESALDSVVVLDNVPPVIVMPVVVLAPPPFPQFGMNLIGQSFGYLGGVDLMVGPPDTLQAMVTDNHALAWAGWTLGTPANIGDSVALTGTAATLSFPLSLPASLLGTAPALTFFVRDVDGNTTSQMLGQSPIAQQLDHPVLSAPLSLAPSDLTFDMKRGLVYLAEPDSMKIAVLSLSTMSYQAPIIFPWRPARMDVTVGGDSLLVVFDSSATLAIVNLASGARPFTTFPLRAIFDATISPYTAGWASGVRVAADSRAIITMYSPADRTNGAIELNLLTDSQRVVAHPNYSYNPAIPGVIRSPNGDSVTFGAFYYQRSYDATTHTYTSDLYDYNNLGPPVISTNNGTTHYLIGGYALETFPGLNALGSIGVDPFLLGAIAPDGTEAYRAQSACGDIQFSQPCLDTAAGIILHYRIPVSLNAGTTVYAGVQSGQLLDYSATPNVGEYWAVSPDGNTLIGIGTNTIMTLNLTQTVPPSGNRVMASRGRSQNRIVIARGRPTVISVVGSANAPTARSSEITIRLEARMTREPAGGFHPAGRR